MSRFLSSLCAAGLLWTAAEAAAVLPRLTVTNLGPSTGAPYSVLGDINDSGQAIGFAVAADPATDFAPFLYSAATGMLDFRTLAVAGVEAEFLRGMAHRRTVDGSPIIIRDRQLARG